MLCNLLCNLISDFKADLFTGISVLYQEALLALSALEINFSQWGRECC